MTIDLEQKLETRFDKETIIEFVSKEAEYFRFFTREEWRVMKILAEKYKPAKG